MKNESKTPAEYASTIKQIARQYVDTDKDFLLTIAQMIEESRINPDKTIEHRLRREFAHRSANYCDFFGTVADLFV